MTIGNLGNSMVANDKVTKVKLNICLFSQNIYIRVLQRGFNIKIII